MAFRSATYQNQSLSWNDTTTLQIENGAVLQIDLQAVNTTFVASNPLQWTGSQPAGCTVTVVSPSQLLLSVPNSLEESDNKTYQFAVACQTHKQPSPQQTDQLTVLLKGYPG